MLERAEIKDSHGKDFAFSYMFMIFPPFVMWEEAMVLSTSGVEKEEDFLKKNLEFDSASSLWVKFSAPDYNVTVIAPSAVNYQVYGTGHNNYTLLFADKGGGGKVHLHPRTHDRWVVSINGTVPIHRVHVTRDAHQHNAPTMTVGGHHIWMHGFTKPLEIVDQQDRLHIYLINPDDPTNRTNRVTLTPSDLKLSNENERETLQNEYKHPGGSLNPVQRFQKLEDCNWLDLDPGESGGVDMMIPTHFDGAIQKDQVLPAGLYVEIFRASSFSGLGQVTARIDTGNPEGTFVSSRIKYLMDNSPHTLGHFLENDRRTLQGRIGAGTPLDSMAFKFVGHIQLDAGQHHFIVGSDDGFRLSVNDQELMKYPGLRPFANSSASYTATASGLYGFELLYWENQGGHKLHASMDGYTLNATRLFNEQSAGHTHTVAKLPEDIRPIAGWPDFGYFLYSHGTRTMFYRQPMEGGGDKSDAHLLKLPRQYDKKLDDKKLDTRNFAGMVLPLAA
jgi:hypothetical protein